MVRAPVRDGKTASPDESVRFEDAMRAAASPRSPNSEGENDGVPAFGLAATAGIDGGAAARRGVLVSFGRAVGTGKRDGDRPLAGESIFSPDCT